jgi:hypothetical protein
VFEHKGNTDVDPLFHRTAHDFFVMQRHITWPPINYFSLCLSNKTKTKAHTEYINLKFDKSLVKRTLKYNTKIIKSTNQFYVIFQHVRPLLQVLFI